ncbi:hypothetical protein [Spiroplasma endosymbiont of Seladonia tumulorum]|uniref:hypothetical protein n=1 Tax=Spiroplasma endosymbiont of Seladonia tumulorum TaxID=3066321 RepID=UPI0030D29B1A
MDLPLIKFPSETVLGALVNYVTNPKQRDLKPMKANLGIMPTLTTKFKNKPEKNLALYSRAKKRKKKLLKNIKLNYNTYKEIY